MLGNAILSVIPYINPDWKPPTAVTYIEGALTLAGCCFFLISSFLSWLEALNADRQGCFGWKQEEVASTDATVAGAEPGRRTRLVPDWNCIHKRNNYGNLFRESSDKDKYSSSHRYVAVTSNHNSGGFDSDDKTQWRWLPGEFQLSGRNRNSIFSPARPSISFAFHGRLRLVNFC